MMFPLIALGAAAIVGSIAAASASSGSSADHSEKPSRGRERSDSSSARPQSYVVTPIPQERASEFSAIEAVRRFIV